jgi:hypothetical protein
MQEQAIALHGVSLLCMLPLNQQTADQCSALCGDAHSGTIYRLDVANPSATPQIVAKGVRNSVGLEHHPDTKVRCCRPAYLL